VKVSSISGNTLESGLVTNQHDIALAMAVQDHLAALYQTIDRMGTAIALGEKGDLEAAHQFRVNSIGKD
jgi:hypothetical protein